MLFNIVIPIQWKFLLTESKYNVSPFLTKVLFKIFANAMTAQLSYHVQQFETITLSKFGWEQNEISIEHKLGWKNL